MLITEKKESAEKPDGASHNQSVEVSLRSKVSAGMGALSKMLTENGVLQLSNQIYNITLGMNPAAISSTIAIVRLWDAITDPLMGKLSDNARTKWGRRKPFILVGSFLCALGFPLLWLPDTHWNPMDLSMYFMAASLVFFTFNTVFTVPFNAMLMEATQDYSQRTKLFSFVAFFAKIGWIGLGWVFYLAQLEFFGDTMTGMRIIACVIGVLIFLGGLAAVTGLEEGNLKVAQKQEKVKLMESLRVAFKNKAFICLTGIIIFTLVGTYMVYSLGFYLNAYYVFGGDTKEAAKIGGIIVAVTLPVQMLVVIVIGKYFSDYEKNRIILLCLGIAFLASLSKWFCITPSFPYLQILPPLLIAPANACFWLLIDSLKADVCDYDEYQTGIRREGIFGAVSSWLTKFALSLAMGLSGFILVWCGFEQSLGGEQPERAILAMRLCFAGIPSVSILLAIIFMIKYPLDKPRLAEIQKVLVQRRADA